MPKKKKAYDLPSKILDRAEKLVTKGAYAEARTLLALLIDALPKWKEDDYRYDEPPARVYNLYARAHRGLGDFTKARAAFRMATRFGSRESCFSLLDIQSNEQPDFAQVIAFGVDEVRLWLLDGTAREIVPWAAALGSRFTADTLARTMP